MRAKEAVAALEAIDYRDPEAAHIYAEQILLECVSPSVREAFKQLRLNCAWWAFA